MMNNVNKSTILHAFFIPCVFSLFIILSFVFEKGMGLNFSDGGIFPREPVRLWTIVSSVFVHADLSHLLNNILSFFLLSVSLFYFYRPVALRVFCCLWLISGLLLWIVGRPDIHIGASGLIYAEASFLFFSGIVRKHIPLIAISLVVTVLYGNMIWHIFPWQINDPVSWEGHLTGLLTGLMFSVVFRNQGPQKPQKIWDDEDDTSDEYWNVSETADAGSTNAPPEE